MIKQTHIIMIAITLGGTIFGMEEKKATIASTLTQRNITTNTAQSTQQPLLSQAPQEPIVKEGSFTNQLKGECYNCVGTILCCGCFCTISSYCVKNVLQRLDENS